MNKIEIELMRATATKFLAKGIFKVTTPPLENVQSTYKNIRQAEYRKTHKRKD